MSFSTKKNTIIPTAIYVGSTLNNLAHGWGRLTTIEVPSVFAYVYEGTFKLGRPEGRGLLSDNDGNYSIVTYRNGKTIDIELIDYVHDQVSESEWNYNVSDHQPQYSATVKSIIEDLKTASM